MKDQRVTKAKAFALRFFLLLLVSLKNCNLCSNFKAVSETSPPRPLRAFAHGLNQFSILLNASIKAFEQKKLGDVFVFFFLSSIKNWHCRFKSRQQGLVYFIIIIFLQKSTPSEI